MNKGLVREGYNLAADDYAKTRNQSSNIKYLKKFSALLKENSTIFDIGCGAGLPIDKFFIEKGHQIIGIDVSGKQIGMARRNIPEAKYEVKDMSELKKNKYKVDGVVSFYAIFHIPREEHQDLFLKFNSFLPVGGMLLVTMGANEWEGVDDNFHGAQMWWSHFGPKKNREIIENAGFEILLNEIETSDGKNHQVILAKKS